MRIYDNICTKVPKRLAISYDGTEETKLTSETAAARTGKLKQVGEQRQHWNSKGTSKAEKGGETATRIDHGGVKPWNKNGKQRREKDQARKKEVTKKGQARQEKKGKHMGEERKQRRSFEKWKPMTN